MRNRLILVSAAALLSLSASAYAQDTVIVQDPVTTESTVVVPGEVRTYVLQQDIPSVSYEGDILVGKVVPESVEIHAIEGQPDYAYTVVNQHRVIVNPQTRTVIQILE